MKTTFCIDDTIVRRLREEAMRQGTTMSALAEAGIRRILDAGHSAGPAPSDLTPLPTWHGGEMLVDISKRDELYRVMEED